MKKVTEQVDRAKEMSQKAMKVVKENLGGMTKEDQALSSMVLGIAAWGLGALSIGTMLNTIGVCAGLGAVAFGFKGKNSDNPTMKKVAIVGVGMGTLAIVVRMMR